MASKTFTINFMGDTMLGRLIDQMFPQRVNEPEEARIVQSLRSSRRAPTIYGPESPWGNTLPILRSADLNVLNLETSATTHSMKWPNKVFNYRMHPANLEALKTAKIDYAGLANNHTLDFCEPGLLETVRALKRIDVQFAGAGESQEEALRPAVLHLPSTRGEDHEVHIWAAADHPQYWERVPTFHFIDYTSKTRDRLKTLSTTSNSQPALKIFSVHWGPNYSWQPSNEIRDLAHFLIDECGIDIIHGHSSHHVQGVEKYKGKLIIYGCGDFVDDYALTAGYRNDLSGIWQVEVAEEGSIGSETETAERVLRAKGLEFRPTIIDRFQARLLRPDEVDTQWVCQKVQSLSKELGTEVDFNSKAGTVSLSFD